MTSLEDRESSARSRLATIAAAKIAAATALSTQSALDGKHVPQQCRRNPLTNVLVEAQAPGFPAHRRIVAGPGVVHRRRARHLVVDLFRRGVVVERDRTPQDSL